MLAQTLIACRLAVPFFSPRDTYISLEKIVEHVPNYGYQLYFADKISNKEIANNVRSEIHLIRHSLITLVQLELFLSIAYRSGSQNGEEGQGFTAEGSLRQMILGQKEHKSSQPYLLTPEVRTTFKPRSELMTIAYICCHRKPNIIWNSWQIWMDHWIIIALTSHVSRKKEVSYFANLFDLHVCW